MDNCRSFRCGNGFFIAGGIGNQLSDSFVEGNENGVYVQGEKEMLICGNEIKGNTVAGVRFLRSGGQVMDNIIHDNQTGVLAAEDEPLTLWRNSFYGNASASLYMKDITSGKISFNTFDGTEKVFMELDGPIVDMLIFQNTFHGGINRIIDHTGDQVLLDLNNWNK